MQITIKVHEDITGALEAFPETKKLVMSRAINRTVDWSRTRTLEAITQGISVKKSDLDGHHRFGGVKGIKSTANHLSGEVDVTGNRIPLFRFSGTPKTGPNPNGITYQITADGGRKRLTANAFTAVMGSEHTGFFKRESEGTKHTKILARSGKRAGKMIWSEGPLIELYGPSIPQVAEKSPDFKKLVEVDAGERLELQMHRELNFALTGNSKGEGSGG